MGIDIRDGLQYQCTGCALCIDACNNIMEKLDRPRELIRYTTENRLAGLTTGILRPRLFIYAALIVGMLVAVGWGLINRNVIALDVIRDRSSLFRDSGDGNIENLFRLRIMNKDDTAHVFQVDIVGLEGATIDMDSAIPPVESGTIHDHIIRIKIDPANLNGVRSTEFQIKLKASDDDSLSVSEDSVYLGPTNF
jgi:polyferredoxin